MSHNSWVTEQVNLAFEKMEKDTKVTNLSYQPSMGVERAGMNGYLNQYSTTYMLFGYCL